MNELKDVTETTTALCDSTEKLLLSIAIFIVITAMWYFVCWAFFTKQIRKNRNPLDAFSSAVAILFIMTAITAFATLSCWGRWLLFSKATGEMPPINWLVWGTTFLVSTAASVIYKTIFKRKEG